MAFAVDLVVILIVFFCTLFGYRKGFILSFYNFFGGFLGFVLSTIFARPLGKYFANFFIKPFFEKYLTNAFQEFCTKTGETADSNEIFSTAVAFFEKHGIGRDALQMIFDNAGNDVQKFVDSSISAASASIAEYTGHAVAFVLLFILFFVAFKIIFKFFDLLAKLPFLNFANRSLGLVCGLFYGVFLAFLFSAVLVFSEPFIQSSDVSFLSDFSLESTCITKFFASFV